MIRKTRAGWLVLGYLIYLMESDKCDVTLMEIAIVMRLNYSTVRGIISRMEKKDYITVMKYVDRPAENNIVRPHALVSMKGHSKDIHLLFEWLCGFYSLADGERL